MTRDEVATSRGKFTRPPHVVVDTTEFRADLTLGTRWTATLSAGSHGLLKLLVPEIVRHETVRHHDRMVAEGEREALKGLNLIRRYTEQPDDIIDAAEITAICDHIRRTFPHKLEYYVERAGGQFLSMPKIDHESLVNRAMEGRKPFDSNGREGYRDALIWYSILELCHSLDENDHVLFVTGNSRDFCGTNDDTLAETLQHDLAQLGSPPIITVFPTLRALHDACGNDINALATPPNRPPRYSPAPPNPHVLADHIGKMCDALIGSTVPSVDISAPFDQAGPLPIAIDDVLVRDVEEIEEPKLGAPLTPLIDDSITCEIAQYAFVVHEGTMTESAIAAYAPNEIDELTAIQPLSEPGQVRVHFVRPALLTFQVTYNVIDGGVDEIQLALVEYVADFLAENPELHFDEPSSNAD